MITVKLMGNKALLGKHENQNLLDNFLSNTANFTNYEKTFLTLTLYIRGLYAPLRNSTQNSFKKSLTLKAERRSEE